MKKKYLILYIFLFFVPNFSCDNKKQTDQEKNRIKQDNMEKQIQAIISQMTLDEKISLLHANSHFSVAGVPRFNLHSLNMIDGPNGIKYDYTKDWQIPENVDEQASTYLPVGMALASTWNTQLAKQYGDVLGNEAKYRGKHVVLGPSLNIVRTPLCGRNFEYLSEDPYLISQIVVPYIKGLQQNNVAACAKHYIANNQEILRDYINVNMSERALREIYLPGFKAAVQEGKVYSVMSAYNKFRGDYCSESNYLLTDLLKNEWNFTGAVISDWGAVHSTSKAALAGTDIEMGTEIKLGNDSYDQFYMADPLKEKVKSGEIDQKVIDEKVERIIRLILRTKHGKGNYNGEFNTREHQKVALNVALESIVLLKNEKSILPVDLSHTKTIAVIGENATRLHGQGGGAAGIMPKYEISPLEGLKKIVDDNVKIIYAKGYSSVKDEDQTKINQQALKIAKSADVVFFFGGLNHGDISSNETREFDTEFFDKKNLQLPYNQNALIKKLAKINPNMAVILISGGAVKMPFIEDVPSIVQAFYPGMETGNALAQILTGIQNPSGKLPVTFPKKIDDMGAHALGEYPGTDDSTVFYHDNIYVGYRYLVSNNIEALFPFGHGLSYTKFKYSDLKIDVNNNKIMAAINIKNIGEAEGAEVVQVYIEDIKSELPRPKLELKAFKKIKLKPNESKQIKFTLNEKKLAYYNDNLNKWITEPGKFKIHIGSSSEDIRLSETFVWK